MTRNGGDQWLYSAPSRRERREGDTKGEEAKERLIDGARRERRSDGENPSERLLPERALLLVANRSHCRTVTLLRRDPHVAFEVI